jgi:hypothetical protein
MGFVRSTRAVRLRWSSKLGGEPSVRHANPAATIAGPSFKNLVMVPALSGMASRWASANQSYLKPNWELSQTDASERTLAVVQWQWRESPPVGGTSCPPHHR